jgi:group I intron endonuclease
MNSNKESNKINIIPIVTYNNANLDMLIVYRENIGKSGIYRWVNNLNGKSHIGSSISLSYKINIYYSLSSLREIKGSIIISRALLKYGYDNFSIDILEYCELDVLIAREQYYISLLKPEYNIKVLNPKD